ncbi:hypothetical protein [Xanthocytophaga agilis]|uniref:Uncharacterized protein n=1 Tax=Xanthocytophaga agilis TaxID=3048010 RepID=A0AAE3R0J5_9BACT|nr:hypothetical protein [Xanthocytophaga agilis]MDJ1499474.1 hypothetical protein [Xanthocytophaga agilis]
MKIILSICALAFSICAYSQNSQYITPLVLSEAKNALEIVKNRLDTNNYLLYNLRDKYLIVGKVAKEYQLFLVQTVFDDKSHTTTYKLIREDLITDSILLNSAFQGKSYDRRFRQSAIEPAVSYLYYYQKIKGNKICEFFLPVLSYTHDYKLEYPISNDLNKFLFDELRKD